jgi:hypothetical protein
MPQGGASLAQRPPPLSNVAIFIPIPWEEPAGACVLTARHVDFQGDVSTSNWRNCAEEKWKEQLALTWDLQKTIPGDILITGATAS